jgi:hypothetical protein
METFTYQVAPNWQSGTPRSFASKYRQMTFFTTLKNTAIGNNHQVWYAINPRCYITVPIKLNEIQTKRKFQFRYTGITATGYVVGNYSPQKVAHFMYIYNNIINVFSIYDLCSMQTPTPTHGVCRTKNPSMTYINNNYNRFHISNIVEECFLTVWLCWWNQNTSVHSYTMKRLTRETLFKSSTPTFYSVYIVHH